MTIETAKRTRRWPRYRLDVPLRVIVHGPGKTTVGRGNELNEGGMALTAGVELKLGDQTEIEFTPPYAGLPIRIRGVVRNRNGYRYGMEFVAENDREEEEVLRWRTMLGVLSTN
jgi:PilZ domain-containing protein